MTSLSTRLVKLTAAVTIVASVFGPSTPLPTFKVHAQSVEPTAGDPDPAIAQTVQQANASIQSPTVESFVGLSDAPTAQNVTPGQQETWQKSVATNGKIPTAENSTDLDCKFTDGMGLALCVSGFVYWITVGLGSWVANITAYVFDYAVMLSLSGAAYALDFIAIGWGIVRDVANMSFLFILIYIAFKIMFQAETAGTIRMLVWVVVIALLVNFSFVMTRVVIDAGNIVALQFYNAIAAGSPYINNDAKPANGGIPVKDISSSIMYALNPQDIIGTSGGQFKNYVANKDNSPMYLLIVSSVIYILTGLCLFMIAAIFIFAAVRFVMRVIGLAGLIIVAPAAFVAAIFRGKEGGAKWFNKWFGYLLEYTFYPAIFLFLFYIEVRFMQEMGNARLFNDVFNTVGKSGQSWTMIAQASANVGVRLAYIIASMYLVLRASSWSSEAFNKVGTSWVQNKVVGLGRGALKLGGAGAARVGNLAYQQSIGRGAASLNQNLKNSRFGNNWFGYRARGAAQTVAGARVGGARSFADFKSDRDKEIKERGSNLRDMENRSLIDRLNTASGTLSDAERRRITGMTQREIESLGAERVAKLAGSAVSGTTGADFWGDNKMRAIQKSEKFSDAEKESIYASWDKAKNTKLPLSVPSAPMLAKALEQMDADKEQRRKESALGDALDALHGSKLPPPLPTINLPDTTNTPPPAAPAAAMPQPSNDNQTLEELRGIKATQQSIFQLATNILNSSPKAPPAVIQSTTQRVEIRPTAGHEGITQEQLSELAKEVAHKLEPKITELESALQHGPDNTSPSPAAPAAARPHNPENDNNPPPNPGLGGMQPLPKAA